MSRKQPSVPTVRMTISKEEAKEILSSRDKRGVESTGRPAGSTMTSKEYSKRYGRSKLTKILEEQPTPPSTPKQIDRMPEPAPEAGGPVLPEPITLTYENFQIADAGHWGIVCDIHIPYHDKTTIEKWVDECKSRDAAGLLINGDLLDCYQLSHHYAEPRKERFRDEIDCGKQFLIWLRSRFPKARIIYKEGNHDYRFRSYLAERAPALFDIPGFDLPTFLGLADLGIEWVQDKRIVSLGKLLVVHGHEFRGGGGVTPARWLFLRSISTALCGHFHQTSEHHERGLDQRMHGVWSVGCACFLYPQWMPVNKWNHGYALVEVSKDGQFWVTNRRLSGAGTVW